MAPPQNLPLTSSNKYKNTFLCITDLDPGGHYELTYDLFSAQTIAGIPISSLAQYMDQQTSRLWKRPLNPIKNLTNLLRKALLTIKKMYEVDAKASQMMSGYIMEKSCLQHTLRHNQLLWVDLHKRLTRYAKVQLGSQEATAKDLIDTWDHPSTAWSAYFANFFEAALGYQKTVDGIEPWQFEDSMREFINTSKMLMADVEEKWTTIVDEPVVYEPSFYEYGYLTMTTTSTDSADDSTQDRDSFDSARDMELLFPPI